MKRLTTILLSAILVCGTLSAQTQWIDPLQSGPVVNGQGWAELRGGYDRLPARAEGVVPDYVWYLSHHAAGLNLRFTCNSDNIIVRYTIGGARQNVHFCTMGCSGLDLYMTTPAGKTLWCAPDFLPAFADTVTYRYTEITYKEDAPKTADFTLYLPSYNNILSLEIGIDEGSSIQFHPQPEEKPIVVYGTSIAQGACPTRAGLAWPNIIERELGRPVVNLGFSGSARMEPEVYDFLAEIDAWLYIIDAVPNMAEIIPEVYPRTLAGVAKLRAAHPYTPILLVEHCGNAGDKASSAKAGCLQTNVELRRAYDKLRADGVKGLYYLTHEDIGLGMDSMVEGVHPGDVGMRQYADAYEKAIAKIARKHKSRE